MRARSFFKGRFPVSVVLTFALCGLCLASPSRLPAQTAVVLSAGGARGLAHIGALTVIDSLGIKPDLVVGVSMGAVVGAMYAAGYSATAIRQMVNALDWNDLFMPNALTIGPRSVATVPTLHWAIALDRFEFSRGFIPDWRVNRTLAHLLFDANARSRGDFDRLPRRLRMLAADFETGEPVLLDRGDLALAVRASMAEPGFFTPVLWEKRTVTDGALVDYMPIGLARSLGATSIIAVDVVQPPEKIERKDPLALADRAISMLIIGARADTASADYLALPKLQPEQTSFTYPGDAEPLIRKGSEATTTALAAFRHIPTLSRKQAALPGSFASVVIESSDSSLIKLGRAVFRNVAPGPFSRLAVMQRVDRLYASGFTEAVWPRVEAVRQVNSGNALDSSATLVVRIDSRSSASIDFAAAYDSDRGGRFWTALQKRTSALGAPTEFELSAGIDAALEDWAMLSVRRASLHLPLVWRASGYFRERRVRFVENLPAPGVVAVRHTGAAIGAELRHIFPDRIFSISLQAEKIQGDNGLEGSSYGPALRFTIPRAVSRIVGVPTEIEAQFRYGDIPYTFVGARGSLSASFGRLRGAVVADVAVADRDAPPDILPSLGDNRALPGYRWGEGRGPVRAVAGVDLAHPIPMGGHVRLRLRAGAVTMTPNDLDDTDNWGGGAEVGTVWSTPLGMLSVYAGLNEHTTHPRFGVVFGAPF